MRRNATQGGAYLYNLTSGVWTDLGAAASSPALSLASGANFGASVALNNNYALIGASGAGSSGQGNAYLYNLTSGAWTVLGRGWNACGLAGIGQRVWRIHLSGDDRRDGDRQGVFYHLGAMAWTDLTASTTFGGYAGTPHYAAISDNYAILARAVCWDGACQSTLYWADLSKL